MPLHPLPARRRRRRIILTGVLLTLLGAGGLYAHRLVQMAADRLTTAKRYSPGAEVRRLMAHPEAEGLRLHPFTVTTADGFRLRALFVSAESSPDGSAVLRERREGLRRCWPELPEPGPDQCRGLVLMLHGINSREEHMLWHARWMVAPGFQCVAWDSRGHGESDAATVTFGLREKEDINRVLAAAQQQPDFPAEAPLLAYGHSMGAANLLQWLPGQNAVRAAVAVAPFAELSTVMETQAADKAGGLLTLLVPLVRREVKSRAGFDPARISPLQSAPGIPCPVFFVHGANDNVIPPEQSALLLEACTAPGTCRTVTGGGHSDALTAGGIQLQAEVLKFYFRQTER